jgi:hypothetical protein
MTRAKQAFVIALASGAAIVVSGSEPDASFHSARRCVAGMQTRVELDIFNISLMGAI